MKIVLVAGDFAQSDALARLEIELLNSRHKTSSFLGYGKPLNVSNAEMVSAVAKSDVVICGMSNQCKKEISASRAALRDGKPFGYFIDTYGGHQLPAFKELRPYANFIFTFSEEEASDARLIFPNTQVTVTGNPRWEDFAFPHMTRSAVRTKLQIEENEALILAVGLKDFAFNMMLFCPLIEALHRPVLLCKNPHVIFGLHPGDPTPEEMYQGLATHSVIPVQILTREIMSSPDIVPGIDLLVASGSNLGIEAAMQRKPVIDFFSAFLCNYRSEQEERTGWKPCELGASQAVYGDTTELAAAIETLLTPEGFALMHKQQEAAYPLPSKKGATVEKMVQYLEKLVSN